MSLGTSNRDGGKTSESGHLRALSKMVNGNVIDGLLVSVRSSGANMSVDIASGDSFIRRSDNSYAHPVFNDAVYNQAIATADAANPRRDIIVIYVDYANATSTAVSNNTNGVVKIAVVAGTPAGSPVDPTDSAIQTSVGAGNPWTKLARVRVPAGQTSITNTLIDDLRVMITSRANTANTAAIPDKAVTLPKLADSLPTGKFYAYNANTGQAIPNATFTPVVFNAVQFNPDGWYNTATNRFTPQVAGYYLVGTFVGLLNAADTATYHVALQLNGVNQGWTRVKQSGSGEIGGYAASPIYFNGTTDYFTVAVFTSGGATSIAGSIQNTYCFGYRIL